jgi:hypothetical protein
LNVEPLIEIPLPTEKVLYFIGAMAVVLLLAKNDD